MHVVTPATPLDSTSVTPSGGEVVIEDGQKVEWMGVNVTELP